MDPLTAVLDGHRARGAHVLRVDMAAPWGISVEDDATVAILVVTRGEAHLALPSGEHVALASGDVAITARGLRYTFADSPTTPASIVIGPGETSRDLVGNELCIELSHGVRRWGNAVRGEDTFVVGTYELPGQVTGQLLDTIPDLVVVRGRDWPDGLGEVLVGALVTELERDLPGQDVVVDRLVDLVLVGALRAWLSRPDVAAPAWWQAQADPLIGPVLSAMHADPARGWTLEGLAREVNVSRATLARRFTELAGVPPMTYLARWRLGLAAELLVETDATVEQVARQVGYQSPFAFSAAFRRVHGRSPRDFRRERARRRAMGTRTSEPIPRLL
jgi:AraC-like DNA-binding protein